MPERLPQIVLLRHGETDWSKSGKHTGRTDIPLTDAGVSAARAIAPRLEGRSFLEVWSSPSQRAQRTCLEAGFGGSMVIHPDLAEWDYGAYEGRKTVDILAERPGWKLFRDGCPKGETPNDVSARADRIVARARELYGDVLIVSSSHFLRVLASRWIGQPVEGGAYLILGTASLSVLGYEHDMSEPAIRCWNLT